MYTLHIQNEKVRSNVALIVETIRHHQLQKHQELKQKTLEFTISLKTGILHSHAALTSEGKPILIHLDLDKHYVRISEIQGAKPFNLQQMDPKGRQVLLETAHYLKEALLHLHNIQEFAHIEFEASMDEIVGRELLQESWHFVERSDVELMLLNTPPGTYLFRKDRFASVMEEILSAAKKSRIRCFTLSYLDQSGQVREKTIVTWRDHWIFYDDDPTLSGQFFDSLENLLASLGQVLIRPLPALRR